MGTGDRRRYGHRTVKESRTGRWGPLVTPLLLQGWGECRVRWVRYEMPMLKISLEKELPCKPLSLAPRDGDMWSPWPDIYLFWSSDPRDTSAGD